MPDADTNQPVYWSGGVSLDMWTDSPGPDYMMSIRNVLVSPLP